MDPHKDMPSGTGPAWTDEDPVPGGNVQVQVNTELET